ncbi:hypothetical protein D3C81_1509090 [compost metagenome]
MQVEDGLSARFAVELHQAETVRLQRLFHRTGGALDGCGQLGQNLGLDLEQIARLRGLGHHQDMTFGLGEDVHEGQDVVVFPHLHAGNFAAQNFGEDVVGVVGAVKAHGEAPSEVSRRG